MNNVLQVVRTGRLELLLAHIPASCRVLVIVDGLEQLRGCPALTWIGSQLPSHVRMVLFCGDMSAADKVTAALPSVVPADTVY